jgi:hypothetical protein
MCIVPPQPPNDVKLRRITHGQLFFNWTSSLPHCPSIHYDITTSSCGECPESTTGSTITCNVLAINESRMCKLIIQTVVCGSIPGTTSDPITVLIKGNKFNSYNEIINLIILL